jgi:predicted RNase H-like nuclease (RuvC/YqgF family)
VPPDNLEEYYRLLQDANGELEEEIYMASQEIERLQAQLAAAKAALALEKKEKKKVTDSGWALNDVLAELVCTDLCPEAWRKDINRALNKWHKNFPK